MTNKNITKILIDRGLPTFVKEEYPMFEAFSAAVLDWLQTQKNAADIINNLREYRDIDRTLDEFVEYFRHEYLHNIPNEILADKRLLVKLIRDFYQNKGNENSFRFLFRLLYNEDIEFYYPKVDILKASDGKWVQSVTIKILATGLDDDEINSLFGATLTGHTSMARGNVETIATYEERGISILEVFLVNLKGTFIAGELIDLDVDVTPPLHVLECYTRIVMTDEGTKYSVGDNVKVFDGSDIVSKGKVKTIGRGPVVSLAIDVGGVGYSGLERDVSDFEFLTMSYTWEGMLLDEATISGDDYEFETSTISFAIADATIEDVADEIRIIDTPDQIGSGAVGRVTHVSQEGEILEVELVDDYGGKDYNIPTATVISTYGTGAEISVTGGGGAIKSIDLTTFPVILLNSSGLDGLTVDFSEGTGTGAAGTMSGSTGLITYKGNYINTDGHLSSNKRLQDNFFYQDFSYVILSGISHSKWEDIVRKIAHPSGFKDFGRIKLKASFSVGDSEIEEVELLTKIISATGGILTITPHTTSLKKKYKLSAGTGSYAISGQPAQLFTYFVPAATGSYSITGQTTLKLKYGRKLHAGTGSYILTGNAVSFLH